MNRGGVSFMPCILRCPVEGCKTPTMKQNTEHRLAEIERRLALIETSARVRRKKQAWRAHIGWAAGDKLYDEALKLGARYRRAQG